LGKKNPYPNVSRRTKIKMNKTEKYKRGAKQYKNSRN
jgi:hypothetical protein